MNAAELTATERRRLTISSLIPFVLLPVGGLALWLLWPQSEAGRSGSERATISLLVLAVVMNVVHCLQSAYCWIREGEPPGLMGAFEPRTLRDFQRTLRARPSRTDEEFAAAYDHDSGVPAEIPIRLRRLLEEITGIDLSGLAADDNLLAPTDELDWADVLHRMSREFGLPFSPSTLDGFDGSFDALVRRVAAAQSVASHRPAS